ncbi:MAG: adenylate/guanylate cyclase domain-containing protein [Acidimicrobiia bacterium]
MPDWIGRIADFGIDEEDSQEERLRKAALNLVVLLIIVLSVVWVATYALLGFYLSAAVPFTYQIIAVVSLAVLARGGDFDNFSRLHFVLWLTLPLFLQVSLGGFVASSGVILWSLVAALGALIFAQHPIRWFVTYTLLVILSGLIEPLLDPAPVPVAVNLAFFVLNIGAVSGVIYFVMRYFMGGLAMERERSERLLLNVLPAATARRLKAGEVLIADRFEEVAVLFADIVDFTSMSETLSPEEMVGLLDDLFPAFDALADRWGLEKIKTIGDAYLAVSGLPVPTQDPAGSAAQMAIEMQQQASLLRESLRLRVGIDVGPVTAGVIGRRKFAYDLWGDTVNTASRMQSHGVPGRIQVTERAYELLRHRFSFETRGPIEVKGKGLLTPYLIVGPKPVSASTQRHPRASRAGTSGEAP